MSAFRPYWAVIVDSFRESLHSKVLWCLLALITFLLLALAPVGIAFTNATLLHHSEIDEIAKFAKQLEQSGDEPADNPRAIVWAQLSEELRTDLAAMAADESPDRRARHDAKNRLAKELNKQIDKDELFTESQLASLSLNKEGEELAKIPAKERTRSQKSRLHRLALAACYPRFFRRGAREAMQVTYLGIKASDPLPFDREMLDTGVKYGLVVFMSIFAAPLGVFTAILVTASIIPNMFDAGSVNLLFSKPINRAVLYLTKFFGGCWFVFINATYLIVGVWLLLGMRIGIWHEKLLWVIPVLTFLFAVYYSVSAFAGIVWRNTIMCITAAVLFWAVCFAVGFLHEILDGLLVQPQRISRIVETPDSILVVKETGEVDRWNDERKDWEPVFAQLGGQMGPAFARRSRLIGPVYDSENKRILAINRDFSNSRLIAGSPDDNYQRERIDTAPARSIALLAEPNIESEASNETSFIVVERDGIFRLVPKTGPENKTLNIFGAKYTLGPKRGSFESAGPKPYEHTRDATQAIINPKDGSLFIFAPGVIHRLKATGPERKYAATNERAFSNDQMDGLLAVGGEHLLFAPEEGDIELLDANSLETRQAFPKESNQVPRFASGSPDGRFLCVVFHNHTAWCYDTQSEKVVSSDLPHQGSITALAFNEKNQLLIASDPPQVETYDLAHLDTISTQKGNYPLLDSIHYYAIRPFYRVFPKPGRLKETAEYLMMDRETIPQGPDQSLSGARAQFRPWKPVWEGVIFMTVMLGLACVYIQRQEL